MKKQFTTCLSALLLCFVAKTNVKAQVYSIGTPTSNIDNLTIPSGVSDDGKVIGLSSVSANYYYTQQAGLVKIGSFVNDNLYTAGKVGITKDGKKAVLYSGNAQDNVNQMAIYNIDSKTWQYLGSTSGGTFKKDDTTPYGMTPDGSTIVGMALADDYSYVKGISWNATTGMKDVGTIVPDSVYGVYDVSDNASVMVGFQTAEDGSRYASYWKNGTQKVFDEDSGMPLNPFEAVSGDGKWALGSTYTKAIMWNETAGLKELNYTHTSNPEAVGVATASNYDASIVIGYYIGEEYSIPGDGEGFIYLKNSGIKNLNTYVKSLGFDDLGITFSSPLAMSSNGKQIIGVGSKANGLMVPFLITLPDSVLATNNVKSNDLEIYPNPVVTDLNVKTSGKIESFDIFDMSGKKVTSNKSVAGDKSINVASLPKGTYLLKLIIDGEIVTKQFVKK